MFVAHAVALHIMSVTVASSGSQSIQEVDQILALAVKNQVCPHSFKEERVSYLTQHAY